MRAVLAEQGHNPYMAKCASAELERVVDQDSWTELLDAYARCVRITRSEPRYQLDPEKFTLSLEEQLWKTYLQSSELLDGSVAGLVDAIKILEPSISSFFDGVLVMDEDLAVRQNRLALIQSIASITEGVADLSHLEGF